jgi:hypothetical protein
MSCLLGASKTSVLKPGESPRSESCHEAAKKRQQSLLEMKSRTKPSHQRYRLRSNSYGSRKGTAWLQQPTILLHLPPFIPPTGRGVKESFLDKSCDLA